MVFNFFYFLLVLNQCMNSFLISADGQTDSTATWNVKVGGDTVRMMGLAVLGSLYCSVRATSLCSKVLFRHV